MFLDILQGLLRETEKVGEAVGIEGARGFRIDLNVERHGRASTESVHVFFQRGGKPIVVENGRAQVAGEGAHIVDRGFQLLSQIGEFLPKPSGDLVVRGQADACGDGGEDLRDVVVQLAADRLLLRLLRLQDIFGQELQFLHLLRHFPGNLAGLPTFHRKRAMSSRAVFCSVVRNVLQLCSSQNKLPLTFFIHTCRRFVVGGVVIQQIGMPA